MADHMELDDPLLGQSPAFLDLVDRVSRLAPLNRPVLILGERGTGKELISRRLHFLSERWDRPFVQMNCAALPETLLESELFGHEAGAFTDARTARKGRFELAHGGTLFLDEIATLSQTAQEKLLRIIEYGRYERLGGNDTLSTDVRIIGATNVDLQAAARGGRFRPDLLDRLAFDVVHMPPLRQRPEDIPLLAHHFARAMASELGWAVFPGFTAEAERALAQYRWPGNVRELKNVVERSVHGWGDEDEPVAHIILDAFESPFSPMPEPRDEAPEAPSAPRRAFRFPMDYREAVSSYEKDILNAALAAHRFHQRDTARALGLTYDQLRHALKKHGLL
jgi:psp operon transcriptional activator